MTLSVITIEKHAVTLTRPWFSVSKVSQKLISAVKYKFDFQLLRSDSKWVVKNH